jgi:hypothetical protein
MIKKNTMLTTKEFYITKKVHNEIIENLDTYYYQLDKFKNLDDNRLLKWVCEAIKENTNLWLYLTIQGKRKEFALNSYYYLLQVAKEKTEQQENKIWRIALDFSKRKLITLFENYDSNPITI